MDLIQYIGSIGGIAGVLAFIIFLIYRQDKKSSEDRMREDRKFMEDRLTIVCENYDKTVKGITGVMSELYAYLRGKNGH